MPAYRAEQILSAAVNRPRASFLAKRDLLFIVNDASPDSTGAVANELAPLMKKGFDEDFRQPGDPDPEIISVSAKKFYGKGYEDCDHRTPDMTKARTRLGRHSKHDIRSVIHHTMKYFVDQHRAKQAA